MIEYNQHHQAYFIINVTDLQKAQDFYRDVLGLETLFDHKIAGLPHEFGWVEMSLPCSGARLGLNLVKEGGVKGGSGQLCLYVTDINAVRAYIEQKGVETREVPDDYAGKKIGRTVYGYGFFNMVDPFGNEILCVGNNSTRVSQQGDAITG